MTELAVTGYASLDYPIGLSGQIHGDQTTLIDHRDPAAWPRVGGCPAYVSRAVTSQGQTVSPVTWVGSGPDSDRFVAVLRDAGIGTNGIARLPSERTPTAILAYQADGSCACLFDPVFTGDEELTQSQRDLIGSASHLCISVGPPQLIGAIVESRAPGARLYWLVKNDTHCFTDAIRKDLSSCADVIFCNGSERNLLMEVAPETIIVETRGTDAIAVEENGQVQTLPVNALSVRDTTGAGDTLAGGYIAAEMAGTGDAMQAAASGLAAVRTMLEQRLERETP